MYDATKDIIHVKYNAQYVLHEWNNSSHVLAEETTTQTTPEGSPDIPPELLASEQYPASTNLLFTFHNHYKGVHGYLAVAVCSIGIVANLLNMAVLTRRSMVTPTNFLLTGLALSDTLTMAAYLPFALQFYCVYGSESSPRRNTLAAARYMLFFASFSVLVHTLSIWLTVILALSRFLYTRFPLYARTLCTITWARRLVCVAIGISMCLCIPNLTVLTIIRHDKTGPNASEPVLVWVIGIRGDTPLQLWVCQMNFWVQAVFVKLLPSLTLTLLSLLILRTIRAADHRRQSLSSFVANNRRPGGGGKSAYSRSCRSCRTTRLLLTVVVLFVLTEFPQGILHLLSGILPGFFQHVYDPLGDFLDILVLINSAINLLLYCCMSQKFRQTFVLMMEDNSVIRVMKRVCVRRVN